METLLNKIGSLIHDKMLRRPVPHPAFEITLEIPMDMYKGVENGILKHAQISIEIEFADFPRFSRCNRCVQVVGRKRIERWPAKNPHSKQAGL